jgi:hypothetical protein
MTGRRKTVLRRQPKPAIMVPVEKTTRKISSSGGYSRVISLPRRFLAKLGWRGKQNLEITMDDKKKRLIIADSKEK